MEGVPGSVSPDTHPDVGQVPLLDEALIAREVAKSLQNGQLGAQVRQTFSAMNAADQRIATLSGEVTDLEGRVDQTAIAVEQRLVEKGQGIQEALFSTEQAASAALAQKGKIIFGQIEERGASYVRDAKQAAQDAGMEADRATIEAERVDGAVKATAEMITEARVVVNGLQSGSLEKIVEAIRYIRSHPDDHRQEIALLQQAEGMATPTHVNQPLVDAAIRAGVPVWLHGKMGSGKSTGAEIAAERFSLDFGAIPLSPTTSKTEFSGFRDANGNYNSTDFRRIYENGGIYLFDEIDNANPSILTVLNGGIANGHFSFPDERVAKHPTTRFIAAANTIGKGATAEYVGRNRIDAATTDRFAFIQWDADKNLRDAIAQDMTKQEAARKMGRPYKEIDIAEGRVPTIKEWTQTADDYERVVDEHRGINMVVSPRAVILGKQLIEAGVGDKWLREMLIYKGMAEPERRKIDTHLNRPYRP